MRKNALNPPQQKASKEIQERLAKFGIALLFAEIRCVDKETEYLTSRGWKKISDYNGEKIAVWSQDGTIIFKRPLAYIVNKNSKLSHIQTTSFDACITDEHRVPYLTERNKMYVKEWEEVKDFCSLRLPATFTNYSKKKLTISMELLRVLVMQSADGSIMKGYKNFKIAINVKKDRKKDRVIKLLEDAKIPYTINKSGLGYMRVTYYPPKEIAQKGLKKLWGLSYSQMQELYEELLFWDGCKLYRNDTGSYVCTFTGNKADCDVVQYVFSNVFETRVSLYRDTREYKKEPLYAVRVAEKSKVHFILKSNRTVTTFYDNSYCFTTDTGFWLSRRNNVITPTGNSGKTRAFLDASRGHKTLVVTKKNAMSGIISEANVLNLSLDVINYHSIQKLNPDDYELIVLDECHLYISQATPKTSTIWKNVVKFTRNRLLIYSSGTPTPETYAGLYHMLALSTYTPFKHKRFTLFFKEYGIPSKIYTGTFEVPCYKKTKEDLLLGKIKHLVVKMTRKETGHIHEAKDIDHVVSMNKQQKKLTKKLTDNNIIEKPVLILADTGVKLLIKLHQIAGGIAVKGEDKDILYLKKTAPKIKYIKENFNVDTTIILCYYKHEQETLAKIFPHTGSVVKMSTGVDLSHYRTMVVYSMAFSSANYEQVKGRLMNIKRKKKIAVHYLLTGIDNYVLKAVRAKENFTRRWYVRECNTSKNH